MNKLLKQYQNEVEFPDVSGFEHLQMLDIRDELEEIKSELSGPELEVLNITDQRFLEQATAFHAQLASVTDLAYEREQRNPPPTHWWWYLDVLVQLPLPMLKVAQPQVEA
jgi:hypothetical protein